MTNGKMGAAVKRFAVRPGRKLPKWLWIAIAASLGVETGAVRRRFVAVVLHLVTVVSALVFVASTVTYVAWAGLSGRRRLRASNATGGHVGPESSADTTEGLVMVGVAVFWCLLGVYARTLSRRLYSSAQFLQMVRLHAKTILKVNVAFIFFLLMATFVAVNIVDAYDVWYRRSSPCVAEDLSPLVCRVRFASQCVFSAVFIVWNALVGVVLLSVCRTHTIGIRRFIQDLEKEALIYETQRFGPDAPESDLLWLTDNDAEPSSSENVDVESPPAPVTDAGVQGTALQLMAAAGGVATPPSARRMSTAVLLQRHWKIAGAIRLSSLTFQRWTTCVMSFCLAWLCISLVQWLSTTPQTLQIVQVTLAVLVIPLLTTAYAEVNAEGRRLLKSVCPTEDRVAALVALGQSQSAEMTLFGVALTYAALATAAAGLLLALASRVVLKQLGAAPN